MAWGLKYPHDSVFPLVPASFFGYQMSVPANVSAVIDVMYGENATKVCESNYLDHRNVTYQVRNINRYLSEMKEKRKHFLFDKRIA